MKTEFYKYQGTGNDFVMIDNRQESFDKSNIELIAKLCDRRFGIGADGLILLENHPEIDFKMVYFNADGNESSMCGNGGRCIMAFANFLGIVKQKATFEAIDGLHHAVIENDLVKLQMQDVKTIEKLENHLFLNTGSPHHVQLESNLEILGVKEQGRRIRYGAPYFKEGSNVNFVKKLNADSFLVRTYERGVEDETLSCGTGVTAVALAMNYIGETEKNSVILKTPGGQLEVSFKKNGTGYKNIWLIGPATLVFKGEI
ncbi:diaminopimelate epimerase [Subsaxibacter sp. CAU 1640]|uniref:diaminopimelate epimerase n=1 Tax=Subsaxibacter sp. CAU 1640 TaxID=2933271 RepID=UPI002006D728|nr:diaminopimelate epimerase [Subsaxibacter sp. CAU 1640]MCK7590862.1 diaminopimelate epimerase [Subsaxibacter sp. CAU 1640]